MDVIGSPAMPLSAYDVVVANPPYVKFDFLSQELRRKYVEFLGFDSGRRVDAYLAFIRLALAAVKPGGHICLVLPHVFLQANNAANLREEIASDFDVRCLVDLSAVRVFEGTGTYTILLIVQRRGSVGSAGPAQAAIVRDFTGSALQACLENVSTSTPYYDVFELEQAHFGRGPWTLLPPQEMSIQEKLGAFDELGRFLEVHQGIVTGDDETFIIDANAVPAGEGALYAPFLPDRLIERFRVPPRTPRRVFYPFVEKRFLTESEVQERFPKTWAYLETRETRLRGRSSAGKDGWWRPARPRDPQKLLAPKIVCPHLMLTPRFALDLGGKYVVSRAPFMIAREPGDPSLLKYLAAVLNSSAVQWFISRHAHKYGGGYNRVEVNLLTRIPVPNPANLPSPMLNDMMDLVDRLVAATDSSADDKLDRLVSQSFGLSLQDHEFLRGRG